MIILNETEQRLVKYLAEKRIEYDRAAGATATLYAGKQSLQNELDSFGAELAYCKVWNLYPDLDYQHFRPFDAKLPNRMTVDVKHTTMERGRLLVKKIERGEIPDLYALMVGTFPKYRLVGHIRASLALDPKTIDQTLPHPAHAIEQARLILDPRKCTAEKEKI